MPRVIVTERGALGLERCRKFLAKKAPQAALRASEAIAQRLLMLERTPGIGRPFPTDPVLRELVISFGDSGYVALYRHEPENNTVYILAFRHQKEAGY